ncbi:MAG: RluA family pseudouridine synthase [Clostridiales bacterium]|nr:RluA family pseudouridine synthase [Clostridiales bacterium]
MKITPEHVGKRLDIFLAEVEGITRSAAQKLISGEFVTVNDQIPAKNYKLRNGDEVECEFPEPVPADAIPQDLPIDIVYEDTDLLIVNKPKGMVVHPAPGNPDGTLVNALLWHVRDLSGINGVIRPGIVHRIDKDTSGLLIVAKNDAAHLALAEQIKEHSFEREYRAILVGNLRDDRGIVDAPIGRSPRDRKKMAIAANGRPARTHYEVLERFNGYCYVRLVLETGRTHQIRVHMSSLGHPVFGDEVYGANHTPFERQSAISGQCLHAKVIGFRHPTTGEFMRFDSELPDYFEKILGKLRENQEI